MVLRLIIVVLPLSQIYNGNDIWDWYKQGSLIQIDKELIRLHSLHLLKLQQVLGLQSRKEIAPNPIAIENLYR
jgi:hypothetical protein